MQAEIDRLKYEKEFLYNNNMAQAKIIRAKDDKIELLLSINNDNSKKELKAFAKAAMQGILCKPSFTISNCEETIKHSIAHAKELMKQLGEEK